MFGFIRPIFANATEKISAILIPLIYSFPHLVPIYRWLRAIWTIILIYCVGVYYVTIEFLHDRVWHKKRTYLSDLLKMIRSSDFYRNEWRQTAVVTGVEGAIGQEIADLLRRFNFNVVALCQKKKVNFRPDCDDYNRHFVDLSDFDSICKLCEDLEESVTQVDLVVCCAAVMCAPIKFNKYGIEPHMAINLISHALLIRRLNPYMRRKARIMLVSSSVAHIADITERDLDGLFFSRCMSGLHSYANTKLAIAFYAEMLHEATNNIVDREEDEFKEYIVCSAHPGCVSSKLYANLNPISRTIIEKLSTTMRHPEIAAAELLATCFSDNYIGGCYFERLRSLHLRPDLPDSTRKKLFKRVEKVLDLVEDHYEKAKPLPIRYH